jgi:predicted HD superfamily hydrolase involved in NAD metabolism
VELAEAFGLTPEEREKAAIAGLLHDAAKLMSPTDLIAYCNEFELPLAPVDREAIQTLHAFVGAEIVKRQFGLKDDVILNAMRYHTTGRANMSRVEMVVYIADKIESNTRNPLYTQKITAQMDVHQPHSLERTTLYILDNTIQFLIEKHQVIHPRTLEARNSLLSLLKETC